MSAKKPLRSQAWFGRQDKMGFYYRSFLKTQAGGPIALVHDGNMIEVDIETCTLRLCVADAIRTPPGSLDAAGAGQRPGVYEDVYYHVLQADRGADLDFLVGKSGAPVPRDND